MSWDIYGNPLRRGHCEVHPHVHEEYPCSICMSERNYNQQQPIYEIERLNYELDQQNDYIKALKSERDSLAAQVKACSDALKSLLKTPVGIGGSLQADGQFYYKVAESVFKKAESALAKTPQQCLAEIRAEVGRAGFIEGANSMKLVFQYGGTYNTQDKADQYAAKVRQGGEQ